MSLWTYLIFWVISLSLTNWYFLWLSMETLNWIFLIWITNSLTFLMWQGIMSLSFLYAWILVPSFFLILLILCAKMSLPPFSNWAWSLSGKWNLPTWLIFLSLHKTLPLALLVNFWLLESWLLLWAILSIFMLYYIFSLKSLIFISSISDGAWLLSSSWISLSFFWIYIILYSFLWWWLSLNFNLNKLLILLALLALPPSIFFFFKTLIWLSSPLIFSMILSWASLLMFLVYWNYFHSLSFSNSFFFLKHSSNKWITLLLLSQALYFIIL